jgi:hypothetical protein
VSRSLDMTRVCPVCGSTATSGAHSSCGPPKLVPLFNESGKLVPTSRTWGHQTFLVIANRIYPTENTSGFPSSNRLSVPSDAGGEDDRLKPLFLLELCAVPTAREITERPLRKREHRADVQVFELGV